MVIFGPIDFQFGFSINLRVNSEQNNFEVDIIKKCVQHSQLSAQNRPTVTLARNFIIGITW